MIRNKHKRDSIYKTGFLNNPDLKMQLNVSAFIASLSDQERASLLAALQEINGVPFSCIARQELIRAELWFTQRMEQADSKRYSHARTRMWMIFMLLRYAGLRLHEIMILNSENFLFSRGFLEISGRRVVLPRDVAARMGRVWTSWPANNSSNPLQCETSQVRRSLLRCASECSIPAAHLNASSLRRLRGQELEAEGLHPRLVAWYLGKAASPAPYDRDAATYLIETHILTGGKVKTSARNLFRGQIAKINENGILVEVIIKTEADMEISAIITKTSRQSMQLAPGKVINALVKAPWVSILPKEDRAKAADVNCFEGKVDSLQRDEMACEILVTLDKGNQICALYANGASPSSTINAGSQVVVSFSPFSVILTEN